MFFCMDSNTVSNRRPSPEIKTDPSTGIIVCGKQHHTSLFCAQALLKDREMCSADEAAALRCFLLWWEQNDSELQAIKDVGGSAVVRVCKDPRDDCVQITNN